MIDIVVDNFTHDLLHGGGARNTSPFTGAVWSVYSFLDRPVEEFGVSINLVVAVLRKLAASSFNTPVSR